MVDQIANVFTAFLAVIGISFQQRPDEALSVMAVAMILAFASVMLRKTA